MSEEHEKKGENSRLQQEDESYEIMIILSDFSNWKWCQSLCVEYLMSVGRMKKIQKIQLIAILAHCERGKKLKWNFHALKIIGEIRHKFTHSFSFYFLI